jgi:hypothetical protein
MDLTSGFLASSLGMVTVSMPFFMGALICMCVCVCVGRGRGGGCVQTIDPSRFGRDDLHQRDSYIAPLRSSSTDSQAKCRQFGMGHRASWAIVASFLMWSFLVTSESLAYGGVMMTALAGQQLSQLCVCMCPRDGHVPWQSVQCLYLIFAN